MDKRRDRQSGTAWSTLASCGFVVLSACSFSYPLDVDVSHGKVTFSAEKHSSGCLNDLELTSETGETMWKFEGPLRFDNCLNELPLLYGHVPPGSKTAVKAKILKPDVTYYIYASDGSKYYGSFRIREVFVIDSDPEGGHSGPYFRRSLPDAEVSGNGN